MPFHTGQYLESDAHDIIKASPYFNGGETVAFWCSLFVTLRTRRKSTKQGFHSMRHYLVHVRLFYMRCCTVLVLIVF